MSLLVEELSLNAWPALRTIVHEGWLLRFAEGYTKRSNSISPIYTQPQGDIEQRVRYCEEMYGAAKLTTIFKMTPFIPNGLDQYLCQRGYIKRESST